MSLELYYQPQPTHTHAYTQSFTFMSSTLLAGQLLIPGHVAMYRLKPRSNPDLSPELADRAAAQLPKLEPASIKFSVQNMEA